MEDYEIEIDDSTSMLLSAIAKAGNDAYSLATIADVDPNEFREFLSQCGEAKNKEALQLLKAAESRRLGVNKSKSEHAVSQPGKFGGEDTFRVREGMYPVPKQANTIDQTKLRQADVVFARPVPIFNWHIPIAACLVVIAAFSLALYFRNIGNRVNSVAIARFVNASGAWDEQYLSDGISYSLVNSLSKVSNLKVISALSYKGDQPLSVGRRLEAQAMLTGRLVRRGGDLHMSVNLVNVQDSKEIWSQEYQLSNVLATQEQITKEVVEELHLKLTKEEEDQLTTSLTGNPEAYLLYLRGRYYAGQFTREGLAKAVESFEDAIKKDPKYALPYAGLAEAYIKASDSYLPTRVALVKAKEAAEEAVRLRDELAEAHNALALVKLFYWDWPGADQEFKRAIARNPGSAVVRDWYGWYLSLMGRYDEAIKELELAKERDPLSPEINVDLGLPFYFMRQYDRAIERFRAALEIDPNSSYAHLELGKAYLMKGQFSQAIAEFKLSRPSDNVSDPDASALLGYAYALSGNRAEALTILESLKNQSGQSAGTYVPPSALAIVYLGLGDKDRTFEWLEKAYEDHSDSLVWLRVDPIFDNLRPDPRFGNLMRRVGLEQ